MSWYPRTRAVSTLVSARLIIPVPPLYLILVAVLGEAPQSRLFETSVRLEPPHQQVFSGSPTPHA